MAQKLFDLVEQWFGEILSRNIKSNTIDKISDASKDLKDLADSIDNYNDLILEQKKAIEDYIKSGGNDPLHLQNLKDTLKHFKDQQKKDSKDLQKMYDELSKSTGLSTEELQNYIDMIETHGEQAAKAAINTSRFTNIMSKVTDTIGFDLKRLAAEFFTIAAVIDFTVKQLVRNNEILVQSFRNSGGVLGYRNLGFDVYGNNTTKNVGSLSTIASINNISEEGFLGALSGLNKGNVTGGVDFRKGAADIQAFAIQQARLIKLYGVSESDVAKITEVSTQLYGVSIKNLNTQFEKGAVTAKQAGLNVQEYFKNLARLSELAGEVYIKNGIEGMQKLALFATKFGTGIDSLVKFGDVFQNIPDIFEKQSQAVALGLRNYGANTAKMFAQYQLGNLEALSRTAINSLAKDLVKYTDQNGAIDLRGIRALKQLGFGQEQVQLIQRTIQAQKKLGLSFEELTDISNLSADKQFKYYEEMNRSATIQEKLNKLWGQFKGLILDPIASVLGPALDITINTLILLFQTLYVVLKPVIGAFQIIGGILTRVSNVIAGVTGFIEEKFKSIGISGGRLSNIFNKIIDIASSVIAALVTFRVATYAATAAQSFSGKSGSIANLLGNLPLGARGSAMARLLGRNASKGLGGLIGRFGPKLARGAGIAMIGGIAGDAISSLGEEGSIVNRLGGAVSGAATGAAIGSIIPGIGTAIGTAVGGILGLFKFDEIKDAMFKAVDWLKKIFGPVAYLLPIFNTFVIIKDMWAKWFGDSKKEDENKKIQTFSDDFNLLNKLNTTINARNVEQFKAEKAQEKRLQQLNKPIIHVETSLMGDAKVKLSGY